MYQLNINGKWRGTFKTIEKAMVDVEKHAVPWKYSWEILDSFKKVVAKG